MIWRVHVWITSVCDRMCGDCCQHLSTRPGEHAAWTSFEYAARYLRGQSLCVIGGEPTTHPEFDRIAREFHSLFATDYVELATNGYGVVEHAGSMPYFDYVRLTNYPTPRTQAARAWLEAHMRDRLTIEPPTHIPLSRIGGGRPCIRRNFVAYANGHLYPCCVGPGFDGAESIELGDDWVERIGTVPAPCAQCVFST